MRRTSSFLVQPLADEVSFCIFLVNQIHFFMGDIIAVNLASHFQKSKIVLIVPFARATVPDSFLK